MKVTVYELLGMVKDGKKLPKKIKVLDVIYEFDDHYGDYFNKSLDRYLFVYMASEEEWKLAYFLNIQAEILEEEKEIPEKLDKYADISGDLALEWSGSEKKLKDKINEIIDCLDYLKSKGE